MTSHMKAWRLERPGGALTFKDVPIPEPRPGSVLVRIEVSTLMSYMKGYVEGRLPFYNPPKVEYTIGTNGVGIVEAVGGDVWHIKPGQRVLISSHFIARDNVDDPNQILIGLTAGTGATRCCRTGQTGRLQNTPWYPSRLSRLSMAWTTSMRPILLLCPAA